MENISSPRFAYSYFNSYLPSNYNSATNQPSVQARNTKDIFNRIQISHNNQVPEPPPMFVSQPTKLPAPSDEITVNSKSYRVLKLLGSGGSCKVYSVNDAEKRSLAAIKRVDLRNADPSIQDGYRKEIEYLRKLQCSLRVIKMYDYEYRCDELILVLEHGDIDFAKYISNEAKLKRLTPLMIKFYWSQMLEAVADIHKYGIVHSDLKPANFLFVKGNLKLIDFGIATSVPDDKTSTFRDTQVGTLNYMSPEAITQQTSDTKHAVFKVGVKSDVWSLGCILYNLVYGFTPFHHLENYVLKIHAIINPSFEIEFKPLPDHNLLSVLKLCLKRNPKERPSVTELLGHPYLTENKTSSSVESNEYPVVGAASVPTAPVYFSVPSASTHQVTMTSFNPGYTPPAYSSLTYLPSPATTYLPAPYTAAPVQHHLPVNQTPTGVAPNTVQLTMMQGNTVVLSQQSSFLTSGAGYTF